jgi:dienelactone hydrolase
MISTHGSHPIGRTSHLLIDEARENRMIGVELWFPRTSPDGDPMMYELLPGVGFYGAALAGGSPVTTPLPTVIVSHGHMGTRLVYSQLCEALASHGYAVMALDHQGDTMADVLLGGGVDEDTNIAMRVADLQFLLDAALGRIAGFDHGLSIDQSAISALGHSFGAYAIFAWAGTDQGRSSLRSLVALEPYLVRLTAAELERVATTALIVAGDKDATTPVPTNIDPVLPQLQKDKTTALLLSNVGHQGCSDVGMYIEVAPTVPGVPDFVLEFMGTMGDDTTGTAGDPWRPVTEAHIELVRTWLANIGDSELLASVAQRHSGRPLL